MTEDLKAQKINDLEKLLIKSEQMINAFEEELEYLREQFALMKVNIEELKNIDTLIIYPYPIEENKDEDYEPLKGFPDYEIGKNYNYPIRKVDTKHQLKEFRRGPYIGVKLGKNIIRMKHDLVALQWIPNDDPKIKTEVDHKQQNTFDYKIENLQWKTRSQNLMNRSGMNGKKFHIVDELPNKIEVKEYGNHSFENYFYCDHEFYWFTGDKYRRLNKSTGTNGKTQYVALVDTNGHRKKINIAKYESTLQ